MEESTGAGVPARPASFRHEPTGGRRGPTPEFVLGALAAGLLAITLTFLWLQDWNAHLRVFLLLFSLAFLLYGIAVRLAARGYFETIPRVSLVIFAAAILFRLAVLWTEPTLSEDFYRYLWDGRVQMAGHSPYEYPPGAEELAPLRDQYYPRINWKQFRAPYPPAAENIFYLLARISTNIYAFKFGLLCFDFLLLEILRRLIQREQLPAGTLLIYAWHPLPIVEFAGSAHMDIIGISLLFLTIWLIRRSSSVAGGLSLAVAALVKYLPLFSLPWLVRKDGWKMLFFAAVSGSLLFLQFYTPDLQMLDGIRQYYEKWWFNDSLFSLLRDSFDSAESARRFGIICTLLLTLFCMWRKFSVYRSLFLIYATVLLFSPVVHPWYVCWVLPFLVFHRNDTWLFFGGWITVSYVIRILFPTGAWKEPVWLKLLVYLPLYTLMLIGLVRSMVLRRIPSAPQS